MNKVIKVVKTALGAMFLLGLFIMLGAAGKSDLGANIGEFAPTLATGLIMMLLAFAALYTIEKHERG